MRWLVPVAALALGCPPPARYAVVQPGLSCARAARVAYRTLVALGYTVTDLVPATPATPGVVSATKTAPDGGLTRVRVAIRCDARGAVLQPIEEDLVPVYDFSRLFGYSFKTLVQRPDLEEPRAGSGLEVQVRALATHEAVLELGSAPSVGNAVVVRVTVRNHTERAVGIDPARIELVSPDGGGTGPLIGPALEAVLGEGPGGERVRDEPLAARRVTPRETVAGYLVYPPGVYREARITIEDEETGEAEGFLAPVE